MKVLFLDCNDQLAPIFAHVHGADDPPIDVNMAPAAIAPVDLPRVLAGIAVCLVDHS
jgi:D-3-phosphoglycerate dehydrogenase